MVEQFKIFDLIKDNNQTGYTFWESEKLGHTYGIRQPFNAWDKAPGYIKEGIKSIKNEKAEDYIPIQSKIEKVLWYKDGEADSEDWIMVGMFKNGHYFILEANCCYTGFDISGEISLELYLHLEDLIFYGMSDYIRELIIFHRGNHIKSSF